MRPFRGRGWRHGCRRLGMRLPETLGGSFGGAVDLGEGAVGGDNVGLDDAGAGRGEGVVAEAGEDQTARSIANPRLIRPPWS